MHVDWTGAGRDALDHALARAPLHLSYPLRAVRDEGVRFLFVAQGRERFDVPTDRPAVVLIGDDLARSLGPPGFHFRSLRRLMQRAAVVTVIAGEPVPSVYAMAVLTVDAMKDGPEGTQIVGRLEAVEVGTDDEGDPITSCIVQPVGLLEAALSAKPTERRMTDAQKLALSALTEACLSHGKSAPPAWQLPQPVNTVSMHEWRDELRSRGVIDPEHPNPTVKHTLLSKPLLPAPDGRLGHAGFAYDRMGAQAVGAQQHDVGTPDVLLGRVPVPDNCREPVAIHRRAGDRDARPHPHRLAPQTRNRNPPRTLPSDFSHQRDRHRRLGLPTRTALRHARLRPGTAPCHRLAIGSRERHRRSVACGTSQDHRRRS